MNACYSRQLELLDEADAAYHLARREVYDRLPAGVNIDLVSLDGRQRTALIGLAVAEATLEGYRQDRALLVAV